MSGSLGIACVRFANNHHVRMASGATCLLGSQYLFKKYKIKVFMSIVLAVLSLELAHKLMSSTRDYEDFALGENTTSIFAQVDGRQVHCSDAVDLDFCLDDFRVFNQNFPVTLWLGNSQLHAINQFNSGDLPAPALLHDMLLDKQRYLITLSQPNANLQEHFLLLAYMLQNFKIDTLILPLVFDDMREDGIRETLSPMLEIDTVVDALRITPIGQSLITDIGSASGTDTTGGTVQEVVEDKINKWLNELWAPWASRQEMRGFILTSLYQLRNWVFGIDALSVRRVIPGRYTRNIEALNALLEIARNYQVSVIGYIAPLRDDVPPPYSMSEYHQYKLDLTEIMQNFDLALLDFQSIVPATYWGEKDSTSLSRNAEIDFMHFQAEGHAILAEHIFGAIENIGITNDF